MLKTEFLGLNYHPNPATNTDEVDAEKYFNENYFTIDTNAKKMREKIEYLSAQQPWNTLQGESIHIQDASEWDENKLSLSGNMKQEKREGYNIIPNNLVSGETDGVKYVVNKDKSIVLNGTATKTVILTLNNSNIKVNPGTYKLSGCPTGGSDNTYKLDLILKNTVTSAVRYPKDLGSGYVIEAVNEEIITTTRIVVYSGATLSNLVFKPMLTLKTTEDKSYEQYGAMPSTEFPSMPLVCSGVQKIRQFGKNVFDGEMELGNISAANGANENSSNRIRSKNYINVEGLTVVKLVNEIESIIKVIGVRYYDKNKTFIKSLTIYDTAKIPIDDSTKYIRFIVPDTTDLTLKYGINQDGSEEYEPYTEEINTLDLGTTELCAIKDSSGTVVAQDRAVYKDGKWQWEKNIGKKVFNGTESWNLQSINSYGIANFNIIINDYIGTEQNLAISDYFTSQLSLISNEKNQGFYLNFNKTLFIRLDSSVASTVDEFKTWLSNNNVTLCYVLATPTYTDCTAQQSAVLDKLYNNFKLNKGVNNVIIESDNGVGVNMQLDYMQDNVLRHDKDIAELKQAIVALGGVI